MNKIIFFVLFSCLAVTVKVQQSVTAMTFNIRLNLASDSLNAWPYRKDKVAAQIIFHHADIIGVQEALYEQMTDLQTALMDYSYVGVSRDDGKTKGEFSAIFYNRKRLSIIKTATFWLSQLPQTPGSMGWDAACPRVVTWANMKDKKTGKSFFIFNTHFDHIGKMARKNSALLLLQAVDSIAGKQQAIVMGDFNASILDEPIQLITNTKDQLHLTDTKDISAIAHYGPTGTFNGFEAKEKSDLAIDHIFFNRNVQVRRHATISESWMGRFASDHFAVLAEIVF
jgi:endonuclease/exonuclease/phosphatase family metal-dependent hydrolase